MSRDIIALSTTVYVIFILINLLLTGVTQGGRVALESFVHVRLLNTKSSKTSVLSSCNSTHPYSVT